MTSENSHLRHLGHRREDAFSLTKTQKADMFTIDTITIIVILVAARMGISLKISFIRKG